MSDPPNHIYLALQPETVTALHKLEGRPVVKLRRVLHGLYMSSAH